MFQFPGFPSLHYLFMQRYLNSRQGAFPHSDTCGSLLICSSPQLFAACHVLLRRLMPRHPPYALSSLISRSPLCSRISVLYSRHLPKVFFFSSQIARKNVLFLSLSTISSFCSWIHLTSLALLFSTLSRLLSLYLSLPFQLSMCCFCRRPAAAVFSGQPH